MALIPEPSDGHRPLSVLCLGWHIGAKVLCAHIRQWASQWMDHRSLGGLSGRCAKDALAQVLHALEQDNIVIAQDLAKFFDSILPSHLDVAMQHLGAPPSSVGWCNASTGRTTDYSLWGVCLALHGTVPAWRRDVP